MTCEHNNFQCMANIGRLCGEEGGPITGYTADIEIRCADCGLQFRFVGLNAGSSHIEPRVSIDGTQLRAPIEPAVHEKFLPHAAYTFPSRGRQ